MEKIIVCTIDELTKGKRRVVEHNERQIAVMNIDGALWAMDNVCPHAKGEIVKGRVEDGTITCLNHGTCFDLATGKVRIDMLDEDLREMIDVDNLPFGDLPIFKVYAENNLIVVEIP